MKKFLFLIAVAVAISCSKDDENCPFGKITGHGQNQSGCNITLDNGRTVPVPCDRFDKYPTGECYSGSNTN